MEPRASKNVFVEWRVPDIEHGSNDIKARIFRRKKIMDAMLVEIRKEIERLGTSSRGAGISQSIYPSGPINDSANSCSDPNDIINRDSPDDPIDTFNEVHMEVQVPENTVLREFGQKEKGLERRDNNYKIISTQSLGELAFDGRIA